MAQKPLHLYVEKIISFSSQYGAVDTTNYNICKLIGKPSVYPNYGDRSDAAVFRTYGKFWKFCASYLPEVESEKLPIYTSEDFFEFEIAKPLIITKIEIYETYNPGSIEKIYFYTKSWVKMWERDTDIESEGENVKISRIFTPNIKKIDEKCQLIRIEVNQSANSYYSEYDAICVTGYDPTYSLTDLFCKVSLNDEVELETVPEIERRYNESDELPANKDYISHLPEEILMNIFSHFQLKTLARIASVSRRFLSSVNQALRDVHQLNLRSVWSHLDHKSLVWLGNRCSNLTRVDLSWCGKNKDFTIFGMCHFLVLIGSQLTTLRLSACFFVNDVVVRSISKNCFCLEELDLSSCINITSECFSDLKALTNLRYINLYRTNINTEALCTVLCYWSELVHLNLGSCMQLKRWGEIVFHLGQYCKNLGSIDLWRSQIDSYNLVRLVNSCNGLVELDLGWCMDISSDTGCVRTLASQLPNLKKLFLTSNRSVTDDDLLAISNQCQSLEQLDLLGARHITSKGVLLLLNQCPKLQMLDLSFCLSVDRRLVKNWSEKYPHCTILVSFQDQISY